MLSTDLPALTFAAMALCGSGGGSTGSGSSDSSGAFFSCEDYQIMIDAEIDLGSRCTADEQCDQVIPGTGVGCDTDDVILNIAWDASYLFDLIDEARSNGCSIRFETTGECPLDGMPDCKRGLCGWE